ncbi:MAG: hypothetical protein LQ338_007376, partial [Usnochroma carphineum]
NFNKDYHSLLSAQTNNTLWAALAIGNIPRASALAQERAYIDRLSTATGEVPQPAYITGLPADQKAYVQSFNRQVASIAKVDFFGEARNATNATNATSVSTMGGRQGATTTAGQTSQGPSSSPSASATNTTGSKALGNPSQPTGIYKMAGAAVVGVLGVAAFL